LSDIYLTWK